MPRVPNAVAALRFALWILVGVVFLGVGTPAAAQDAASAAIEVGSATTVTLGELPVTTTAGAGADAPSTVPSAGVGLASGGTGPLSLGALVGAGVAALFALRERHKSR
jgi:hypothetical protein